MLLLTNLLYRRSWLVCHPVLPLFLQSIVLWVPSLLHDVGVPSYFAFQFNTLIQFVFFSVRWLLRRPRCIWCHLPQLLSNFLALSISRSLRGLLFLWTPSHWTFSPPSVSIEAFARVVADDNLPPPPDFHDWEWPSGWESGLGKFYQLGTNISPMIAVPTAWRCYWDVDGSEIIISVNF